LISAGRLRFVASVKRETGVDNLGKKNSNFGSTIGTFRCDLRDVGSTEADYGDGYVLVNTFECHARWDRIADLGVLPTDRLVIQNKTYRINGIRNEYNRNRLAILDVTEIV